MGGGLIMIQCGCCDDTYVRSAGLTSLPADRTLSIGIVEFVPGRVSEGTCFRRSMRSLASFVPVRMYVL